MTDRVVIAHGHIFKNAGTTLDWALARNFGEGFVDHRDNVPMRREGAPYLARYLADRPSVVAISSHHLCYPLPDVAGMRITPVYLLRDPIERVQSVYNFERLQEPLTLGAINAKRFELPEYVDWRMLPETPPTIRDFQSRYLAGRLQPISEPMTAEWLEVAMATLREHAIVGVVERFDESMIAFEATLRTDFPGLDLSYVRQNTSTDPARTRVARIEELATTLGSERYERLVANNRHDLALYEAARAVLDERLARIDDAAAATADFARRNRDLAAAVGADR